MVVCERFHQSRRFLSKGAVVTRLGTENGGLKSPFVKETMSAAEFVDQLFVELCGFGDGRVNVAWHLALGQEFVKFPVLIGRPVKVSHRLEDAMRDVDVIMMLRLQHERMTNGLIPSLREYSRYWGLTLDKLAAHARPDVLIMHPGPVNRGVEISPEVADGPYSVILDQVTNGVAVRMAVLYLLAGGKAA